MARELTVATRDGGSWIDGCVNYLAGAATTGKGDEMSDEQPTWSELGRVLRLAGLFGLVTGTVWALAAGWRGALVGVVGAAVVVGMWVLARLFGLRVALLVATLAVFLLLMFVAPAALGPWRD
jgi:hypothetical protein